MSNVPQSVLDLIEKFDRNIHEYKNPKYNETHIRVEFVNPFFKALGWDVDNKAGYALAYRDVFHEDEVKVAGATKAPDYSFRIGGTRKFFLETKKPSVNLKADPAPAFQLRRYGYSARLPISVLTNFEEFIVYDCRIKPSIRDKPSAGRIKYYTFREYADQWDEISSVFHREAVLRGSFDKYAQDTKGKRGTAEIDKDFLADLDEWRLVLARSFALGNSQLTARELNYAVQMTIDRLIFLRMCEDRGIEQYGQLQTLLNGTRVYPRLVEVYRRADERYNSGLFHFTAQKGYTSAPDVLTPTLNLDDKILKTIIKNVYYPECPYEFSMLPVEVLGNAYEQFLGKTIRLTAGHQAKIEEKPEVRKAGGVYYTPEYIVAYIVKHTVGKLLEDNAPKDVAQIRILDPACGSGSFLLGAYQYLLDWHLDWYKRKMEHTGSIPAIPPPKGRRKRKSEPHAIFQGRNGDWFLSTAEKKRILLNNIHGVDIDQQAVEVTKLSLLLKVLENENQDTLARQLALWRERALPDLGNNIKWGNSLIGPDFYEQLGQSSLFADEEMVHRINTFDWKDKQHGFGEIMTAGGFDAVIGNPPYIFTREQLTDAERSYFAERYEASWEKHNTYMLFVERMFFLMKNEGFGSYIVPNSWLTIESAKLLRPLVIPRLTTILDLNYQAFNRVSMEPSIFVLGPLSAKLPVGACRVLSIPEFLDHDYSPVDRRKWSAPDYRIVFSSSQGISAVIDRVVSNAKTLEEVFDVRTGLQAYEKGKGSPPQSAEDVKNHIFDFDGKVDGDTYRYLQGRDVGRYQLNWSGMWMRHGPWLSQPRNLELFSRPRVLVREITGRLPYCLHATYVEGDYLNNKSILNVLHENDDQTKLKCLCALLNSRMISLYYKDRAVKGARKIFPKIVIRNLREFPYPSHVADKNESRLASLVDDRAGMQLRLAKSSIPGDRAAVERQMAATDLQIDSLVYELYELTPEEIKVVEEALL